MSESDQNEAEQPQQPQTTEQPEEHPNENELDFGDNHMSDVDTHKHADEGELNDILGVNDDGDHDMLDINDETEKQQAQADTGPEWVQIRNLTRPFTEGALRRKIESVGGKIADITSDFWLNSIKSMACVRLENHVEIIEEFKGALNGTNWPNSNPKQLEIVVISNAQKLQEVQDDKMEKVEDKQPTRRRSPSPRKRRSPSPVPPLPDKIDDEKLASLGIFKTKTKPHVYWKLAPKKPKKEEKPEEVKTVEVKTEENGTVEPEVTKQLVEEEEQAVPTGDGESAPPEEEQPTPLVEAESPVATEQTAEMAVGEA